MMFLLSLSACALFQFEPLEIESELRDLPSVFEVEAGTESFQIPFVIEAEDPASATVVVASSDQSVVSNDGLAVGGTGAARVITGSVLGPGTTNLQIDLEASGQTSSFIVVVEVDTDELVFADAVVEVETSATESLAVDPHGVLWGAGYDSTPSLDSRPTLVEFDGDLQIAQHTFLGDQEVLPSQIAFSDDGSTYMATLRPQGSTEDIWKVTPQTIDLVSGGHSLAVDRAGAIAFGGSGRGNLTALDGTTNHTLLTVNTGDWVRAVAMADGILVAAVESDEDYTELQVFDVATGVSSWQHVIDFDYNYVESMAIDATGNITVCGASRLGLVEDNHAMLRQYHADGSFHWTIEEPGPSDGLSCHGLVLDAAGNSYALLSNRTIVAVDSIGNQLWELDTGSDALSAWSLVEHSGVLYVGGRDSSSAPPTNWLVAIDAETGALQPR